MVIVMQQQIEEPVELPIPADQPVIYIQQKDGSWLRDPPNASVLAKNLRLEINPNRPNITMAALAVPGAITRFGAIDWSDPHPTP